MDKKKKGVEEKRKEGPRPEETAEEAPEQQEEDFDALKEKLEEERKKADEYLERWKRSAAEFSNYRKRQDKERNELVKFSNAVLITKLLPVLDDLERAFRTLPDELRNFTWIDGIFLVERKLRALLEQEGLEAIEAQGKPFDPAYHQAIMYEETTEGDDAVVLEELQKGYKLNNKVLRPTLVKVSKKVAPAPEEEAGPGDAEAQEMETEQDSSQSQQQQ